MIRSSLLSATSKNDSNDENTMNSPVRKGSSSGGQQKIPLQCGYAKYQDKKRVWNIRHRPLVDASASDDTAMMRRKSLDSLLMTSPSRKNNKNSNMNGTSMMTSSSELIQHPARLICRLKSKTSSKRSRGSIGGGGSLFARFASSSRNKVSSAAVAPSSSLSSPPPEHLIQSILRGTELASMFQQARNDVVSSEGKQMRCWSYVDRQTINLYPLVEKIIQKTDLATADYDDTTTDDDTYISTRDTLLDRASQFAMKHIAKQVGEQWGESWTAFFDGDTLIDLDDEDEEHNEAFHAMCNLVEYCLYQEKEPVDKGSSPVSVARRNRSQSESSAGSARKKSPRSKRTQRNRKSVLEGTTGGGDYDQQQEEEPPTVVDKTEVGDNKEAEPSDTGTVVTEEEAMTGVEQQQQTVTASAAPANPILSEKEDDNVSSKNEIETKEASAASPIVPEHSDKENTSTAIDEVATSTNASSSSSSSADAVVPHTKNQQLQNGDYETINSKDATATPVARSSSRGKSSDGGKVPPPPREVSFSPNKKDEDNMISSSDLVSKETTTKNMSDREIRSRSKKDNIQVASVDTPAANKAIVDTMQNIDEDPETTTAQPLSPISTSKSTSSHNRNDEEAKIDVIIGDDDVIGDSAITAHGTSSIHPTTSNNERRDVLMPQIKPKDDDKKKNASSIIDSERSKALMSQNSDNDVLRSIFDKIDTSSEKKVAMDETEPDTKPTNESQITNESLSPKELPAVADDSNQIDETGNGNDDSHDKFTEGKAADIASGSATQPQSGSTQQQKSEEKRGTPKKIKTKEASPSRSQDQPRVKTGELMTQNHVSSRTKNDKDTGQLKEDIDWGPEAKGEASTEFENVTSKQQELSSEDDKKVPKQNDDTVSTLAQSKNLQASTSLKQGMDSGRDKGKAPSKVSEGGDESDKESQQDNEPKSDISKKATQKAKTTPTTSTRAAATSDSKKQLKSGSMQKDTDSLKNKVEASTAIRSWTSRSQDWTSIDDTPEGSSNSDPQQAGAVQQGIDIPLTGKNAEPTSKSEEKTGAENSAARLKDAGSNQQQSTSDDQVEAPTESKSQSTTETSGKNKDDISSISTQPTKKTAASEKKQSRVDDTKEGLKGSKAKQTNQHRPPRVETSSQQKNGTSTTSAQSKKSLGTSKKKSRSDSTGDIRKGSQAKPKSQGKPKSKAKVSFSRKKKPKTDAGISASVSQEADHSKRATIKQESAPQTVAAAPSRKKKVSKSEVIDDARQIEAKNEALKNQAEARRKLIDTVPRQALANLMKPVDEALAELGWTIERRSGKKHYFAPGEDWESQHGSKRLNTVTKIMNYLNSEDEWNDHEDMKPVLSVFYSAIEKEAVPPKTSPKSDTVEDKKAPTFSVKKKTSKSSAKTEFKVTGEKTASAHTKRKAREMSKTKDNAQISSKQVDQEDSEQINGNQKDPRSRKNPSRNGRPVVLLESGPISAQNTEKFPPSEQVGSVRVKSDAPGAPSHESFTFETIRKAPKDNEGTVARKRSESEDSASPRRSSRKKFRWDEDEQRQSPFGRSGRLHGTTSTEKCDEIAGVTAKLFSNQNEVAVDDDEDDRIDEEADSSWVPLSHVGHISDYHGYQRKHDSFFPLKFNKSVSETRDAIDATLLQAEKEKLEKSDPEIEDELRIVDNLTSQWYSQKANEEKQQREARKRQKIEQESHGDQSLQGAKEILESCAILFSRTSKEEVDDSTFGVHCDLWTRAERDRKMVGKQSDSHTSYKRRETENNLEFWKEQESCFQLKRASRRQEVEAYRRISAMLLREMRHTFDFIERYNQGLDAQNSPTDDSEKEVESHTEDNEMADSAHSAEDSSVSDDGTDEQEDDDVVDHDDDDDDESDEEDDDDESDEEDDDDDSDEEEMERKSANSISTEQHSQRRSSRSRSAHRTETSTSEMTKQEEEEEKEEENDDNFGTLTLSDTEPLSIQSASLHANGAEASYQPNKVLQSSDLSHVALMRDYQALSKKTKNFLTLPTHGTIESLKAELSQIIIDNDIDEEEDEEILADKRAYGRCQKSYTGKADQERIEKNNHEEQRLLKVREFEFYNNGKKRKRVAPEEEELQLFECRPIRAEKRGGATATDRKKCGFGADCLICRHSARDLKVNDSDKGNLSVFNPGFQRKKIDDVVDSDDDEDGAEDAKSRRSRIAEMNKQKKRSVMELQELMNTIDFIERYKSGLINTEGKKRKREGP